MTTKIYYDGECPFCTKYVTILRLRDAAGKIELVDMRNDLEALKRFTKLGLNTDKGMIVESPGGVLHGADAIHALSMMSTKSGKLNALAALMFRNHLLALILYPVLRVGRNLTLLMLGREPMRSRDPGEVALFEIFSRFMGVLAVLHSLSYVFRYSALHVQWTTPVLLACGLGLILFPNSRRIFLASVIAFAVDGWLQAPLGSNSTVLKNFLILTIILAGGWHIFRGSDWDQFFRDFRPVGQMLLLIMYTFGIFHKINADFLNPETSCAVALWREMPPPLVWIDNTPMHYLAIYGTFIAEGVIMLMLIIPRWRHFGICVGISFHSMLALSGYAMYQTFSTLSIALHTLFISPAAALRIKQSGAWQHFERRLKSPIGVSILLAAFSTIALFALLRDYNSVAYVWVLLMVWPLAIVVIEGRSTAQDEAQEVYLWSPLVGLNVVTILFFLNAASPYMGLKTAQSMNMFANLRLEGGVSNHLILSSPPGPFNYLADLVTVDEATNSPRLEQMAQGENFALVHYHFLSILATEEPDAKVAFTRDGVLYPLATVSSILAEHGDILHSELVRKFFHFRPVNLTLPLTCE